MDCDAYTVWVENEQVEVTSKEFEILQALMGNRGKVLSRESLLDKVCGYNYFDDPRVVDAHIKNIRRKIRVPYIITVKGVGYKIEDPQS
jgi:two-component system, OmpR family, response regulator VanR